MRPEDVEEPRVELRLYLHGDRPLSILASSDGTIRQAVFLPKCLIAFDHASSTSQEIIVTAPEWLAKQKGLI
jgi:hypothetical protein